jgi:hypothetical protein
VQLVLLGLGYTRYYWFRIEFLTGSAELQGYKGVAGATGTTRQLDYLEQLVTRRLSGATGSAGAARNTRCYGLSQEQPWSTRCCYI